MITRHSSLRMANLSVIILYPSQIVRACLHGGGVPQIGEVTRGGSPHLSCKRNQIKIRDYMDRRVTSPKRATAPTLGPPPPFKQALSHNNNKLTFNLKRFCLNS